MQKEVVIKLENVSKVYRIFENEKLRLKEALSITNRKYGRDFYVLENISFELARNETLGIIGLNGAGKSTLLKVISGVLEVTEGSVEVNGRLTSLLELGAGFDQEYNGIQNIYLYGSLFGFSEKEMHEKLDSIVEFADIGDFIYQPVKNYSSGMFARLAFAVIAHLEPSIFIVDEALSVGDIFFQQKCNLFMKEKMDDVTKIIVTHDMNSIASLCDRVIVLDKGNIVFDGNPDKGIEYYLKFSQNKVFNKSEPQFSEVKVNESGFDISQYQEIEEDKLSGSLKAVISHCNVLVNNEKKDIVRVNDVVKAEFIIRTDKRISEVIFGYLIKDKYGNAIFGQNSVNISDEYSLDGNHEYRCSLEFVWPEIAVGDYFLTIGMGDGLDEALHEIVCWAHSVAHFQNINENFVHAMFNNDIKKIELEEKK